MDRKIFELNLGVKPTSLYILICSNYAGNRGPTLDAVRHLWNDTEYALQEALLLLHHRGILANSPPLDPGETLEVTPADQWELIPGRHG